MKAVPMLPGTHLSVRAFAGETGLDRDTVAKRLAAAGIKPSGQRGGSPVYRLRDLLRAAYVTTDDGELDPDRLRPFERHAFYKAEREKLCLQTERAELIPRIEVEQEQARIAKIIAHGLEILPDILERDCGPSPAMVVRIEQHIDAIRERMYEELANAAAEAPSR